MFLRFLARIPRRFRGRSAALPPIAPNVTVALEALVRALVCETETIADLLIPAARVGAMSLLGLNATPFVLSMDPILAKPLFSMKWDPLPTPIAIQSAPVLVLCRLVWPPSCEMSSLVRLAIEHLPIAALWL